MTDPPPGVYASVVKVVTQQDCNECQEESCSMILVEVDGGRYDGHQFLIGACKLTKRKD